MRIAQVAPLFERIPPKRYGGTERVISTLTQELSFMGHEVTVFATADSVVHAELVSCRGTPLTAGAGDSSEAADHILEFDEIRRRLNDFDVIHFHTRFSHFPLFEDIASRTVTTCHNRLDFPELTRFYDRFRVFPLVAVSDAQRRTRPEANWAGVIHHGYPLDHLPAYHRQPAGEGYLAFLGRICAEKGILDAIRIARETGRELRIAARINALDRDYWDGRVAREIDGEQIKYVGEIADVDKPEFLNGAAALLFPIQWPEPFGLVMIEAMACGTPVIAFDTGSVPEVVEHGRSGFIVIDTESAREAVGRLNELDRRKVRACFEERFSSRVMARKHVALYAALLKAGDPSKPAVVQHPVGTPRRGSDRPAAPPGTISPLVSESSAPKPN